MNVNVLYILTRVCTFTSYWMWADQMIESNEKISRTFTHVSMNIYIYIFLSISCIFFQEPFYSLISYNNILYEYFSNIFSILSISFLHSFLYFHFFNRWPNFKIWNNFKKILSYHRKKIYVRTFNSYFFSSSFFKGNNIYWN